MRGFGNYRKQGEKNEAFTKQKKLGVGKEREQGPKPLSAVKKEKREREKDRLVSHHPTDLMNVNTLNIFIV